MTTDTNKKFVAAARGYFSDLHAVHTSGGATEERSGGVAVANLLNAIGETLDPKVVCISELADQGAGHPDFGLYAAGQMQQGLPPQFDRIPEHGVVEMKPADDNIKRTATGKQVIGYWKRYRLVLVTNMWDFLLVVGNTAGKPVVVEKFQLAENANEFWDNVVRPRTFSRKVGVRLGEYLRRALTHEAKLAEPGDLAQLLASYARDGLDRLETAGDVRYLVNVRKALEDALGVRFEGKDGTRFFRSTLVQTLFYGVFSAWVLWARQSPQPTEKFDWHSAVWHLRSPVLAVLFQYLSVPSQLKKIELNEPLDWTAAALDRVDRDVFFERFEDGEAVPYFYEPFLEAFDPELRKELGVWYTPRDVVRYMVARVDLALKDDLGIADGIAAENVYVLDPCCGTGAYLAEVLRKVSTNLKEQQGDDALVGARVKQAATERIFGFEVMPAPFVVAHLQVGLTMQDLGAGLSDSGDERAGIFLTNALTGWGERSTSPVLFQELEEERERAEGVKQEKPILVVIGNPPYNAFARMTIAEERELIKTYQKATTVDVKDTKGLTDLYVRFFRVAERRIAEKTGCGVVCFISNYSWLDGLSFVGMRDRYLDVFDEIRIDCLNGDKYKTGKRAPDGSADPSIFSTEDDPVGIQVGTAIATMIRKEKHKRAETIGFRHLWGRSKRAKLLETMETKPDSLYRRVQPDASLGLPFIAASASDDWNKWPSLLDLIPIYYPGAKTNRDSFLVDIDFDRLKARVEHYFDESLSHDEIERCYPIIMRTASHYDARGIRDTLLKKGGPDDNGFTRFSYRPFDNRWLYWEAETKLLNDKRADYKAHVLDGNLWMSFNRKPQKGGAEPRACITRHFGCHDLIGNATCFFPVWLGDGHEGNDSGTRHANLTGTARRYLENLGMDTDTLFYYVLAVLNDPTYRTENAEVLGIGWPRIPVPGWSKGRSDKHAKELERWAAKGRRLAMLLDADVPIPGVTEGVVEGDVRSIAVRATASGHQMTGVDFTIDGRWGHYGVREAVMPGRGLVKERDYTDEERAALGDKLARLGGTTFDIYLNENAFWKNIPCAVWGYHLGAYPVLKKWLSYREKNILKRPLSNNEVQHFTDTARRITVILSGGE